MKKRFVAFLLVLIMVLGMLPVSAMAAGSVVTARGSAENPIRIYENSGNKAETSNGSVQVPVGETVTDSGVLTFSTYSAIEGVQVSKGGVYCAVTSSNENVVKATGSWSGGVLTINFLGVGNGTAKITVDYTCTCSKNAVANGLLSTTSPLAMVAPLTRLENRMRRQRVTLALSPMQAKLYCSTV